MTSLSLYRYGTGILYFHNDKLYRASDLSIIKDLSVDEVKQIMQNTVRIFSVEEFVNKYLANYEYNGPTFIFTQQDEYLFVSTKVESDDKIHILISSSPDAVNQRIIDISYCQIPDINQIESGKYYINLPSYHFEGHYYHIEHGYSTLEYIRKRMKEIRNPSLKIVLLDDDSLIDYTRTALQKYKRKTYRLEFYYPYELNREESLTDSKIGGIPYMQEGKIWPFCKCGLPMEFGVQINLDTLPTKEFGTGLFQFWCCSNDETTEVITRIIQINGPGIQIVVPKVPTTKIRPEDGVQLQIFEFEKKFPAQIIKWNSEDDYPHLKDVEENDLDEDIWKELDDTSIWEFPESIDKVGGWTSWRQRVVYPECPICQESMTALLLQIAGGSRRHKWDHDEGGMGYIHQCLTHKDQVKFTYSR